MLGRSDDKKGIPNVITAAGEITPASLSDVLYLIATHYTEVIASETMQKLGCANIAFVRGAIGTALHLVNEALQELKPGSAAHADARAFRFFLRTMTTENPLRSMRQDIESAHDESGSVQIVALCAEANEFWHSGNLFKGLWLNQSAFQYAHDAPTIWQLYTGMLLAKKLTDIHISNQATRIVGELRGMIETAGLHVFSSIPEALSSVLHLQAGELDRAAETATAAIDTARQRDTVIGVSASLSVSALAHLGQGEFERAAADLAAYHAQPPDYALPDSVARAAVAEVALLSLRNGARVAADRMWQVWSRLAPASACFVEDLTRPAWLVTVALHAGDTKLAERVLATVRRLAAANPGVHLLAKAVEHADSAFAGEHPDLSPVLDFEAVHRQRRMSRQDGTTQSPASPLPVVDANGVRAHNSRRSRVGRRNGPPPGPTSERLSALSQREKEIARLVGQGMTNQQVANHLGVSPHTVNFHLRSIFRKLAISTRVNLGQLITQIDWEIDHADPPPETRAHSAPAG
ncbi:helix-turn-helix transcriptional regulator [Actinophytocola sp.]|uniref:helix-turn-helix transcriptional regulator n=1 Tax=Actinophytocola sp. TaxID=1872138 RepID=UPI003D6C6056